MFIASHLINVYTLRLCRQTILVSVSTHCLVIQIGSTSSYLYGSFLTNRILLVSFLSIIQVGVLLTWSNDTPNISLNHNPGCTSISILAISYTHTLVTVTHLHRLRASVSHICLTLLGYGWSSIMCSHISCQRIKVANRLVSIIRSLCLLLLIT